jgi:tRNA pseudouridine55 synthase
VDGLIVIDKPSGMTSHDVVFRVRTLLSGEKTGHCGTLDPDATGVLLVTVGRATRLFPYLSGHDKSYRGTIRFGFSTDTYDASGRPTSAASPTSPQKGAVLEAMTKLEGRISQLPPAYSALKKGGRPLYEFARRNVEVVLEPRQVTVHRFVLESYAPPDADFEVKCSPGTYVRSLAHDLGSSLGCGAHLLRLRRTASGPFGLNGARGLDEIESLARAGRWDRIIVPMDGLLEEFPGIPLGTDGVERVGHGNLILPVHIAGGAVWPFAVPPDPGAVFRLLDEKGRLLALARRCSEADGLSPFLVLADLA